MRVLLGFLAALGTTLPGFAQQPVLSVSITHVDLVSLPTSVSQILVTNGGSGYTSAPTVTVAPPAVGVAATATAFVSGGRVTSVTVTGGGSGYNSPPTVFLSGGGTSASGAVAQSILTGAVNNPPNEASGPYGTPINIWANATGTFPAAGFTYTFFVNGISIGTPGNVTAGSENGLSWTPPQPGTYFFTVQATDGANTATSLPIRYFATGTVVNSPVTNTLVPAGSTVVIKADATVGGGFIKSIQFFDNGAPIGTADLTIPFSIIYAVPGVAGSTHAITAQATDNNNALLAVSPAVNLTVVNPIAPSPTSRISTPVNNAVIAVPSDDDTDITVAVDAFSSSGLISKVELYIDGQLFGTDVTFPYTFAWHPTVVGTYKLTVLTYDDKNNVIASNSGVATSVLIAAPPTVTVTFPTDGGTVTGGSPTQLAASATDSSGGTITSVQFFVDGAFAAAGTLSSGSTYTATATLTQRTDPDTGAPVPSVVTAIATNNVGLTGVSPGVSVTVTNGGSGTGVVVGLPPTGVTVTAPAASSVLSVNSPVTITGTATDPDGTISSMQFFVSGQSVGTDNIFPYSTSWTPTSLGTYSLTVRATDNDGNVVASTAVAVSVVDPSGGVAPVVTITTPSSGAAFAVNAPFAITAAATSSGSTIAKVEFFVNGASIGSKLSFPYTVLYTPSSTGTYLIKAVATNSVGVEATSTTITVTVGGNSPPTVTLTNPSSTSVTSAGVPITLAATATDTDGTITDVTFLANNIPVGSAATAPYTATFTPTASGTYSLVARATDNSGNVTSSSSVFLVVSANIAPAVTITAPLSGASITTNTPVTVSATATDSDGTIASVTFFANGIPIGAPVTSPPYRVSWTPAADGVYRLTAMVIDNSGAVTNSTVVAVIVSSTVGNAVYSGIYQNLIGGTENGKFTLVNLGGTSAVFIGHSTAASTVGAPRVHFYRGIELQSDGTFDVAASGTKPSLSGQVFESTTAGNLGSGLFIGSTTAGSGTVPPGFYAGSLTGVASSEVAAIVGVGTTTLGTAASTIMIYVKSGTTIDAGDATMKTDGTFTVTGVNGTAISGRINPSTGLLTATLTGTISGSATGGIASAQSFSDGSLRNLSTRGQVGTGADVLITGFVIGGGTPKHVLVRAVGPSMAKQGIANPLAHPQLQVYRSSGSPIAGAFNDRWSSADASAMASVGAFSLEANTLDAALATTLAPGVYTTQVSGADGGTGVALIEFYDLDSPDPWTTQKVMNVSTRAKVGTGENVLIAGFVISGTTPKKVLVRAVGPTLASLGIPASQVIADPRITLRNVSSPTSIYIVRENDDWEVGNDPLLVRQASTISGAFPIPSGSKDSAILMSLPPGAYTAEVSGESGGTGVALVEVYEVP